MSKYDVGLRRDGIIFNEMVKLIKLYDEIDDPKKIKEKVYSENYLGKNSDRRIDDILRAFEKRFSKNTPNWLPPINFLSSALNAYLPEESKKQLLFPYYLFSDNLLRTTYEKLIIPSFEERKGLTINKMDIFDFIKQLGNRHKNIKGWSEYSKKMWGSRFLTFLRIFSILEKYPSTKLNKMYLLPETFAFFTIWLTDNGTPFRAILAHSIWRFYLMNPEELIERAYYGNKKDWWYFEKAGAIVTFEPRYSLEEWLENGLE